jgi:SAM-dependent methyltransferase
MYDALSVDYDRFVNWNSRLAFELPFIEQQLGVPPGRVLDAACGTGMHAIALAQRGWTAAGADLSPAMITRARENAAAAGVNLALAAAGFGKLAPVFRTEPVFPFDAVLCLGNSLPHLLSPAALAEALVDFATCLRPGGRLILQSRNFDAVLAQRERWMEPQAHRDGEREWLFVRFYDYDPDGLITFNIMTLFREGNANWQQRVATTHLWPQRQAEVVSALAAAGFGEITCYGGLNGAPFDLVNSGNLVVVALLNQ